MRVTCSSPSPTSASLLLPYQLGITEGQFGASNDTKSVTGRCVCELLELEETVFVVNDHEKLTIMAKRARVYHLYHRPRASVEFEASRMRGGGGTDW